MRSTIVGEWAHLLLEVEWNAKSGNQEWFDIVKVGAGK